MDNHVEAHDLSTILVATHENKWVVIAPDYSHVLATGDTLSELSRMVADSRAIFHRVLPHDVSFAPCARMKYRDTLVSGQRDIDGRYTKRTAVELDPHWGPGAQAIPPYKPQ